MNQTDTPSAAAPAAPLRYTDRPRPKVYVPAPAYDWKTEVMFTASLKRAQKHCHAIIEEDYGLGDGVARTRNNLAYRFLRETDAQFIFFIDSDIVFDPVDIDRIVAHDRPICGGLYPKKEGRLSWVVSSLPGEAIDPATRLLKARETGTGFLCVRRDVLEAMIRAYPEIEYEGDPRPGAIRWDFFPMHAQDRRYLSEDWFFCSRARALGFDVMVDTSVQVAHVGKIVFPLCKTLTHEEVVDLIAYRTPHSRETISAFLGLDLVANPLQLPDETLWPQEFIDRGGISPTHCADVLAGCYDLPIEPVPGHPFTVLDLGANIGAFARFAAARWPGCHITCYEPHPKNFLLLEKTLAGLRSLATPPQATAHPLAVVHLTQAASAAGTLPLRRGKNNCGEHSFFDLGEQTAETVEVPFLVATELPPADVLKLDTEGCEHLILETLRATGRITNYRAIVLEYHREDDRESIRRLLSYTHDLIAATSPRLNRGVMKFVRKP